MIVFKWSFPQPGAGQGGASPSRTVRRPAKPPAKLNVRGADFDFEWAAHLARLFQETDYPRKAISSAEPLSPLEAPDHYLESGREQRTDGWNWKAYSPLCLERLETPATDDIGRQLIWFSAPHVGPGHSVKEGKFRRSKLQWK